MTPIDRATPMDSPVDRARQGGLPRDRSRQTSDTSRYRDTNNWDLVRHGIKEAIKGELGEYDRRNGRLGKRAKTQPVASVAVNITRDENGNLSVDGALGASFGIVDIALIPEESLGVSVKIPTPAPGISGIAGVSVDPVTGGLQAVTGGLGLGPIDLTVSISGCFIILSFSVPVPFKLPFKVGVGFGQKKIIPIPGCKLPPPPPRDPQSPGSHDTQDLGFPGLSPEEEDFLIKVCIAHPGCVVDAYFERWWNTVTYFPWEISWEESRQIVENLGDGWLTRTFAGKGAGSVKLDSFVGSIGYSPPSSFYPKGYLSVSVGGRGYGSTDLRAFLANQGSYRGIDYYFSYSSKDYYYYYSGLRPAGYATNYPDYAANPYRLKEINLNCDGVESRIPYPRYSTDKIYNPPLRDLPSEPPTRLGNNYEDDMGNCECACASLRLLREIHEVLNPAQIKAFVAPVCPDPLDPEAPPVEPEVPPEPFVIADYPSLFTYLLMQFCNIGDSNLVKALGFPFTMHKYLNADREGEEEIKNLADLYKNWIEIFDGIVGEFPVKMEIVTDENQTAPLEFTTIADALADIGALNVATAYDADNTFTLLIKVMLQVLKTNSLSYQTYDLMHLTNEQLGFRIKQKPFKQKLPIDPRFPDDWVKFNQDWEPEEDNCISFENDDKDTTKGILILMQEAIAMIKSAHTMSGTPDQIVNRIKGLAQIVQLGRQLGLGETLAEVLSGNWQSTLESFQKPATAASPEIKVSNSESQSPATP